MPSRRHTRPPFPSPGGFPALVLVTVTVLFGCMGPFIPEDGPPSHLISVTFTRPGTAMGTGVDAGLRARLVQFIGSTRTNLDVCYFELTEPGLTEAILAAGRRGVAVRFVGDTNNRSNDGYHALSAAGIPMRLGNGSHTMHHKFLVADDRALAFGSANGTDSAFLLNNENFLFVESPAMAGYFTDEFHEMFSGGRFGPGKQPWDGFASNRFILPDGTATEAWFAPYTRASNRTTTVTGRLLDLISGARHSIEFSLFCFSHEDLAEAMITAHSNHQVRVTGTLDRGWHQSNPYSMHPRLVAAGIPVRFDGNENHDGNDPLHGGKLHDKMMVIDGDDPWGVVVTGSLNFTQSATEGGNDETCVILSNNSWLIRKYREELRGLYRLGTEIR